MILRCEECQGTTFVVSLAYDESNGNWRSEVRCILFGIHIGEVEAEAELAEQERVAE